MAGSWLGNVGGIAADEGFDAWLARPRADSLESVAGTSAESGATLKKTRRETDMVEDLR
jgi:hypothetical protein